MRARRLPVVDEYLDGDQLAVFVGNTVVVLSEVASAALGAVGEQWTELAAITSAVIDGVGSPPAGSPHDAVAAILSYLAERNLVDLSS